VTGYPGKAFTTTTRLANGRYGGAGLRPGGSPGVGRCFGTPGLDRIGTIERKASS